MCAAPAERVTPFLEIHCFGRPRRVGVTIHDGGDPRAAEALAPLAGWLRRQRAWRGDGWVHLRIGEPEVVRRAFGEAGAITSGGELEARAGVEWFYEAEWRRGLFGLFAWQARIRDRLTEELQRRAARRAQARHA